MKRTYTTLVILAVGAVSAHAQLTYTGYSQSAFEEHACNMLSSNRSATATIGDPAFGNLELNLQGMQNARVFRDSNLWPGYWFEARSYFSLKTGATPIELQYAGIVGPRTEGKVVVGGGVANGETTARAQYAFRLFWFDDSNNNDIYDPDLSEEKHTIIDYAGFFTDEQIGNGFLEYDVNGAGSPSRYVLGALSTFGIEMYYGVFGDNSSNPWDPPVTITHEYNAPYDGATIGFHYTAVPEPASMAALGIGVAALMRRRRRK